MPLGLLVLQTGSALVTKPTTKPGVNMGQHTAQIIWQRGEQNFLDKRYSRRHWLSFDGGVQVLGSSSPHVVPVPLSDAAAVDPEEAFVASLSSCHMLWFLSIAAQAGFCVDSYVDKATGVLGPNSEGHIAMTQVTLQPAVRFSGHPVPTREQIERLHHEAHHACYLANSVKTDVRCKPVWPDDAA